MVHLQIAVPGLPDDPLDAAQDFYKSTLPTIRDILAEGLPDAPWKLEDLDLIIIRFPHADHAHLAWRIAVVQELAREAVPVRVNAIAGGSETAAEEVVALLSDAPGITGQLLTV